MHVKTPMGMGLDSFEVRFFVREKFTKVDLALKEVIRSSSKLGS